MPKTICIDIDGTIVNYTDWIDNTHFGKVLDGAPEATQQLHKKGWFIIIYTTRADKEVIEKFLSDNGFYFDSINENPYQPKNAKGGKPIADIYVDDRAICFNGSWEDTLKEIGNFKPWEERKNMKEDNKAEVAKELLVTDFQQALYLHRHYDEMNLKLTNFAFGQVLVSIGACWTLLYAMTTNPKSNLLSYGVPWGIFGILILSAAFSLMSIMLICKNRRYFVKVCRYMNELRDFAIRNNDFKFANISGMWTNPSLPRVRDWASTQLTSYLLIVLCYIVESVGSGVTFCFAADFSCKAIISIIIVVVSIIVVVLISYRYLKEL